MIIAGAAFGVEAGYWRYDQVRLQQAADAAVLCRRGDQARGGGRSSAAAATECGHRGRIQQHHRHDHDQHAVDRHAGRRQFRRGGDSPAPSRRSSSAMFTNKPTVVNASSTASFTTAADACILALSHNASKAANFAGNSRLNVVGCTVMTQLDRRGRPERPGLGHRDRAMHVCGRRRQPGGVDHADDLRGASRPTSRPSPIRTRRWRMPIDPSNCQNQGNGATLYPGHYCSLKLQGRHQPQSRALHRRWRRPEHQRQRRRERLGRDLRSENGAGVSMNGNSDTQLSAPTTGPYAGFLFIADRTQHRRHHHQRRQHLLDDRHHLCAGRRRQLHRQLRGKPAAAPRSSPDGVLVRQHHLQRQLRQLPGWARSRSAAW